MVLSRTEKCAGAGRLSSVLSLSSVIVLICAALLPALLNSLTALSISATDEGQLHGLRLVRIRSQSESR